MRGMTRYVVVLLAGLLSSGTVWCAPEDVARAVAERDAAEERYRMLNSSVEDIASAQAGLRRRLDEFAEVLQRLSNDSKTRPLDSRYVTREEFNKLVETVKEIDRKREADKKQILEELERLQREILASVKEASRKMQSAPQPERPPQREREPVVEDPGDGATTAQQEGVYYTIKGGNTLSAIAAAHNEVFKKQGRRTSVDLIQKANPKLKPTSLIVGQKIFIPMVKD